MLLLFVIFVTLYDLFLFVPVLMFLFVCLFDVFCFVFLCSCVPSVTGLMAVVPDLCHKI